MMQTCQLRFCHHVYTDVAIFQISLVSEIIVGSVANHRVVDDLNFKFGFIKNKTITILAQYIQYVILQEMTGFFLSISLTQTHWE